MVLCVYYYCQKVDNVVKFNSKWFVYVSER